MCLLIDLHNIHGSVGFAGRVTVSSQTNTTKTKKEIMN
jgi:hypothetical protein